MKRIALALLVFALGWLSACALRAVAQDGGSKIITITDPQSGLAVAYDCVPIPTQEGPTSTPSATSPQTPSYTPTTAPLTPTPTMTPLPLCAGTITEVGTRLRESPWGTILDTLTADDLPMSIGIVARVENNGTWYKATANGQTVYVYATLVTLTESSGCTFSTASAPTIKLGLHLTVGASQDVVYSALPRIGLLKCTTGTEAICIGAKQQRPDLLVSYRVVAPDCPPGWAHTDGAALADAWFVAKYSQWSAAGMIGVADLFEPINECGFGGSAFERAFWVHMIELANARGVCLLLFSDSYGTPSILEFQSRAPILDYALAHPCASGRPHALGMHSYEGVQSGDWKWGRWRLLMEALGAKYKAVPIVFSEYAYNFGSGVANCAALWADWAQAAQAFDSQVWGVNYFNVSPIGGWMDVSGCF